MESVAESVAQGGVSAADYGQAFETAVRDAIDGENVVGLKSILAYRATLRIDYESPTPAEVEAAGRALARRDRADWHGAPDRPGDRAAPDLDRR